MHEPFASRWVFDVEILARLIQSGAVKSVQAGIYEYPLSQWKDVAGSKLRLKDFTRAISDTWTIYRRYLSRPDGSI
ncbi:MAG: hypothetical protein WKF37_23560 [Bryobacteraceae bacterium]